MRVFLCVCVYSVSRSLYSVSRSLYSVSRSLYSVSRAVYSVSRSRYSLIVSVVRVLGPRDSEIHAKTCIQKMTLKFMPKKNNSCLVTLKFMPKLVFKRRAFFFSRGRSSGHCGKRSPR